MIPLYLATLCLAPSLFAADLLVVNANILTADRAKPRAEALLVRDGRFAAVGVTAEVRGIALPNVQVLDLEGKTVIPGINDSHLHPRPVFPESSPYFTPSLGPDAVANIAELIAALKRKAERTPKGQVVRGDRYQDTRLGRHPSRFDLDQVSADHPIVISHSSGHISVVNTYVLRAARITKDTPDPPGGALDRDPDGSPNGILRESARRLIAKAIEAGNSVPYAEQVEGMLRCLRQYAARGITSVSAAGISPASVRLFQDVVKAGSPVRVGLMLSEAHFPAAAALGLKSGFGNNMLRLTSIKAFHGNSLSGRTCWLSEEYSDRPGYFGIPPARSQEDFDRAFQTMHDAGWQVATHANGDREIDMVLTAIERAQSKNPRPDPRHRIEHASIMTIPLLERAKRAGVILVFHSYMWEHGDKLEAYGERRLALMHPHRAALDLGIRLAGHSDSPVSAADAMLRMQDMVARQGYNGKKYGANQAVSVEEALEVFTQGGAWTTFEENEKGSITPGKLADFVVLSRDPRRVAPTAIREIAVEATWLGGAKVFP
ncbi:MAG: amidohydrolase [Bryobacteraceae bacterium]|nr:amidohydrolase [Bryobacteraceae bacterium]